MITKLYQKFLTNYSILSGLLLYYILSNKITVSPRIYRQLIEKVHNSVNITRAETTGSTALI